MAGCIGVDGFIGNGHNIHAHQLLSGAQSSVAGLIAHAYRPTMRSDNNLRCQTTSMDVVTAHTDGQPIEPLTPAEEGAWRALARAVGVIPRVLAADLLETHGLSTTEYVVLSNLSEAINQSLRMSELANDASLTGSGMTRVIDRLCRQGLVERVRTEADGRGHYAVLTASGLTRLQEAWPTHLAGVRRHIMDHLRGLDLVSFAEVAAEIADVNIVPPLRRRGSARPQAIRQGRVAGRSVLTTTSGVVHGGNGVGGMVTRSSTEAQQSRCADRVTAAGQNEASIRDGRVTR
jgi:DNA-binding MarR family transcriptional regulator